MKYKDTAKKNSTVKLAGRITPPHASGDLLVLSTLTELSPWEQILIIYQLNPLHLDTLYKMFIRSSGGNSFYITFPYKMGSCWKVWSQILSRQLCSEHHLETMEGTINVQNVDNSSKYCN